MLRKSLLLAAGLGALFLAALLTEVPSAHAAKPVNFTFADDFILFDPCSGENVHIVGEANVSIAVSVQNDIAHLSLHITGRDTGTGQTTGASYKANAEANTNQNVKLVNGTGELNVVFHANVIGPGSVPNLQMKETFHTTVNANGTVTVLRTKIDLDCHG